MVFDATCNNSSILSWQSVLLVEESEYPEETTELSQVTDKLYHMNWIRAHNVSSDSH